MNIHEESQRCLLCENAPCSQACAHGDPVRAVCALRFDNFHAAGQWLLPCADGGQQAITFDADRRPHIVGIKCVGCHLCRLVCPTGAIGAAQRMPKHQLPRTSDPT